MKRKGLVHTQRCEMSSGTQVATRGRRVQGGPESNPGIQGESNPVRLAYKFEGATSLPASLVSLLVPPGPVKHLVH